MGLHEYDGVVQDLSPSGVTRGLARLGVGPGVEDRHDQAHLEAAEAGMRTAFEVARVHRWNPAPHLSNLDLACYDRSYAPAEERERARARHIAGWPDAVGAAVASLDAVPAVVAEALLPAARGLGAGLPAGGAPGADTPAVLAARRAHRRLIEHLEEAARSGPDQVAIGGDVLRRLMADGQAMAVDLSRLEAEASVESSRLEDLLAEACRRIDASRDPASVVARLLRDHPAPEGVAPAALALIQEATSFATAHGLLPALGGECRVGPAPESRRWAMAMMSWAGPYEPDTPAWYYVTPPDPSWPPEEQQEWLAVFSATTLPAITVHEVTPGHFAHSRMLRRVHGDVRRGLHSDAFIEGWAHYAEELMLEEGFRRQDPRYAVGMCVEALLRVTRLRVAIGLHRGDMTLHEAVREFERHAFLRGPAARSEAARGSYDPTYGRYTWGKLEIRRLRDEAIATWGRRYTHLRFHQSLLALGSPPLGLMGDIFSQGRS